MVTRAKRQSNNAWDKDNMRLVACKIRKDIAERFKSATLSSGTTPNAVLRDAVLEFLNEKEVSKEFVLEICTDDPCLFAQIQAVAKQSGQSVNQWIIEAIKDKL